MKAFLVLTLTILAAAQSETGYFPDQPECAVPCLTSAISAAGCPLSDIGCQCGPTQSVIAGNVVGCFLSNCNPAELGQAHSAGQAVCSSFSAGELTVSPSASPSETSSGSISITSPPSTSTDNASTTSSDSSGSDSTSSRGTRTDTLGGGEPSITGDLTSLAVTPTSAIAAPPVQVGAGLFAGIVGVLAAL